MKAEPSAEIEQVNGADAGARGFARDASLLVALLVAWIATVGSLYFSEVRGYVPCVLCWYQRILMYPLALLFAVGLLRRDRHLPYLVLPFSLAGQGVSTYHYLIQKTTIFGAPTACQAGVPCTTAWINWFGFATIPFLAMIAFLLITLFSIVAIYRGEPSEQSHPPWLPVVSIVAIVLIGFSLLARLEREPQTTQAQGLNLVTIASDETAFSPVNPDSIQTDSMQTNAVESRDEQTGGAEQSGGPVSLEEGERLYAEACSGCHGPNGEGVAGLGTDLVTSEFLARESDSEVVEMIRRGRNADHPDSSTGLVMPPSGGRPDLSDAQVLAIVKYLREQK